MSHVHLCTDYSLPSSTLQQFARKPLPLVIFFLTVLFWPIKTCFMGLGRVPYNMVSRAPGSYLCTQQLHYGAIICSFVCLTHCKVPISREEMYSSIQGPAQVWHVGRYKEMCGKGKHKSYIISENFCTTAKTKLSPTYKQKIHTFRQCYEDKVHVQSFSDFVRVRLLY